MTRHKPSKRERAKHSLIGISHSPPTNSKAIRKANIQAVLAQSKGIVWRSDTPSVIAKAYEKSHSIKAYVPIHGQGQAKDKPKVTPSHKRKHMGDVPYVLGNELVDMAKERAKIDPPKRSYKGHKNKTRFRKFNPTGLG